MQRVGNIFVGGILRSPFHRLLSKNTMLITFTGRLSGKRYTTPVNYLLIGDVLSVVSQRDRTWWRNLRGGSLVTLQLNGEKVRGRAVVVEDDEGIHQHLLAYLQQAPIWPDISEWNLMWKGGLMRRMSLGLPGPE